MLTRSHLLSFLVTAIAALSACSSGVPATAGGDAVERVIQDHDTVIVYRLDPSESKAKAEASAEGVILIDGIAVVSQIEADAEFAASLADMFLNSDTYTGDFAACIPMYGAGVEFQSLHGVVQILICMQCQEFKVLLDSSSVGHGSFERVNNEMRQLIEKAFPDIDEIS